MSKNDNAVKVLTPPFTLSFPEVFEMKPGPSGGAPRYSCQAIWRPSEFTKEEKQLWAAMVVALDAMSREWFNTAWKELPANYKRGIRRGEEKADMKGFGPGTFFASLTSKKRQALSLSAVN